jgi:hypothetical protein
MAKLDELMLSDDNALTAGVEDGIARELGLNG